MQTTNTVQDEVERGINTVLESTSRMVPLYYEMIDESLKYYEGERQGNKYLINLIGSSGTSTSHSRRQLLSAILLTMLLWWWIVLRVSAWKQEPCSDLLQNEDRAHGEEGAGM